MRRIRRNGFHSDAAFFELVARQAIDPIDRKQLMKVSSAYRSLATHDTTFGSRQHHWAKRAEECRTLADQFRSEICRLQLLRLADTYDMLAIASETTPDQRSGAVNE